MQANATIEDAFVVLEYSELDLTKALNDAKELYLFVKGELTTNGYSTISFSVDELAMRVYERLYFKPRKIGAGEVPKKAT